MQSCNKIYDSSAPLMCGNYVETFQFSAGQRTHSQWCLPEMTWMKCENCPSVSDVVLISGGRLFHTNEPATEKFRGPKPAVLVRGTTRLPWPAKCKWWRLQTVETVMIIDTRYGVASWWRHF